MQLMLIDGMAQVGFHVAWELIGVIGEADGERFRTVGPVVIYRWIPNNNDHVAEIDFPFFLNTLSIRWYCYPHLMAGCLMFRKWQRWCFVWLLSHCCQPTFLTWCRAISRWMGYHSKKAHRIVDEPLSLAHDDVSWMIFWLINQNTANPFPSILSSSCYKLPTCSLLAPCIVA